MNKVVAWFKTHLPTRESIESNRWTRPFAASLLKPDLWRFNRRSVPRAVAVGLLIAPVVPFAHTLIAALAAVRVRANVVIAAGITWLMNPFTMPPFYYSAYKIGSAMLALDSMSPVPGVTHAATGHAMRWAQWLFAKTGPLALGTFVMAVVWSSIGYLIASFFWRWKIGRKWRARRNRNTPSG
jgi:uncharacterized protein